MVNHRILIQPSSVVVVVVVWLVGLRFSQKKEFCFESGLFYFDGCDLTNIDTNPRMAPRITKAPPSPPETIPSTNSTIAHTKVPTIFDPITQITPITIATILYIAPVK